MSAPDSDRSRLDLVLPNQHELSTTVAANTSHLSDYRYPRSVLVKCVWGALVR